MRLPKLDRSLEQITVSSVERTKKFLSTFKAWLVQGAAGVAALAMLAPRLQWVVAAVVC